MTTVTSEAKQHAHDLVDRLGPAKLDAVVRLLEVMVDDADDELTEEDRVTIQAGLEYFAKGGEGIPFEQVVADCGFTMDQIRGKEPRT